MPKFFVVTGVTDRRKSFNGLASIVKHELKMTTDDGHVFCFLNRRRNRMKILVFDGSGLWVRARRLEMGTFSWPMQSDDDVGEELTMLLAGIDIRQVESRRWYKKTLKPCASTP